MNINDAKKFINELYLKNLMYHFEDDAEDCLDGDVDKIEINKIQKKVNDIYNANLDWGKFECPIGYCLHIMKSGGNA